MTWRLIPVVIACLLNLLSVALAYSMESNDASLHRGDSYIAILCGYGVTHVGMGKTREHVETSDIVFRYGHVLRSDMGSSWYRGRHDVLIEVPINLVMKPVVSPMVGINFLAGYYILSLSKGVPYLFAGGGPVYTEADIPGLGANLNGNYQAGIGFIYKTEKGNYLNMEYRFHHISNAGTEDPNVPLNSSKLLLGITFF